jgi:homoserine O-acetyltransferase
MNSHDVSRGRGTRAEALARLEQPTLVVGISSDILYPLHEQKELVSLLPNARLCVLDAPYGHDSFLVESKRLLETIQPFIDAASRPESERAQRTNGIRREPVFHSSHFFVPSTTAEGLAES